MELNIDLVLENINEYEKTYCIYITLQLPKIR